MDERDKRSVKRSRKQNVTDQIFMRSLRRMILGLLLSVGCLISSTWAWFMASSDARLLQVQLPNAILEVTNSQTNESISQNTRSAQRLQAGSYTITAEPFSGASSMYCLIKVQSSESEQERLKKAIETYNEGDEIKWRPLLASDSNSIRVFKSDDELNTFFEKLEEKENYTYDSLMVPAVIEGTYQVIWEPNEDRIFELELEEDALVSFDVFWLTENEKEYPSLDAITEYHYAVLYYVEKAETLPIDKPEIIEKLPVKLSPEKLEKVPIKLSPEKLEKQPIKLSPEKLEKQPVELSPEKLEKLPVELSPEKLEKLPVESVSEKVEETQIESTPKKTDEPVTELPTEIPAEPSAAESTPEPEETQTEVTDEAIESTTPMDNENPGDLTDANSN